MVSQWLFFFFFFFNDTATTEIYTLSLHDALPILLTATVGGGLRDHSSVRADQPDTGAGDSGACLICHKTAEAAVSAQQRGGVGLRRKLHTFRQRDDGSAPVEWLGKLLNEGMRRAGDKRQLHVVPIFTNSVVHDGPALQQRFFF